MHLYLHTYKITRHFRSTFHLLLFLKKKIQVHAPTREEARHKLLAALTETTIAGLECNLEYLRQLIASPVFAAGNVTCQYLNGAFHYRPLTVDVIDGGAATTVQDYPGRIGHWAAGVSPR